jgi:hypothetical protein
MTGFETARADLFEGMVFVTPGPEPALLDVAVSADELCTVTVFAPLPPVTVRVPTEPAAQEMVPGASPATDVSGPP